MNIYDIANKLDTFMKEYDYYEYMDNINASDPVDELCEQLQDQRKIQGIVDYLEDALYELDEMEDLYEVASSLLEDLENLQNNHKPSLADKLFAAEQKQSEYSYDEDAYSKDDYYL